MSLQCTFERHAVRCSDVTRVRRDVDRVREQQKWNTQAVPRRIHEDDAAERFSLRIRATETRRASTVHPLSVGEGLSGTNAPGRGQRERFRRAKCYVTERGRSKMRYPNYYVCENVFSGPSVESRARKKYHSSAGTNTVKFVYPGASPLGPFPRGGRNPAGLPLSFVLTSVERKQYCIFAGARCVFLFPLITRISGARPVCRDLHSRRTEPRLDQRRLLRSNAGGREPPMKCGESSGLISRRSVIVCAQAAIIIVDRRVKY